MFGRTGPVCRFAETPRTQCQGLIGAYHIAARMPRGNKQRFLTRQSCRDIVWRRQA
jgi:hypothetical protein